MAVDVVKVPHHGSQHNVGETTLLARVVGKDYVFCGDGFKNNPEISVIKAMVKNRLKAPGKFKFWFNSSEAVLKNPDRRKHMRKVEETVGTLAKSSGGRKKTGRSGASESGQCERRSLNPVRLWSRKVRPY